jgi:GTP diphosphokinase / guanosine-3',5'-bis(diphosphate) 3'-diphosphatase
MKDLRKRELLNEIMKTTGIISKAQLKVITGSYRILLKSCSHIDNPKDLSLIRAAFIFVLEAHKDLRSETGEPHFLHAIAVAKIVADEMGLTVTSIVSALLQDILGESTVADTNLVEKFGAETTGILISLQRISSLRMDKVSMNAGNFIQLLLSLSEDVRVILIRLADRLHFMRTIGSLSPENQLQISSETSSLYAPIAHRLGLYKIKTELEELAMQYSHPDIYKSIAHKIEQSRESQEQYINKFVAPIRKNLLTQGFDVEIKARTKSISSIWAKMRKQNVEFDQVYDLFAIRIISNSPIEREKEDCWKIYSIVTDICQPNPLRLRDWISVPKVNGYESLHTTVKGQDEKWVEVQIRTRRMNELAEGGHAAHWKYKEMKNEQDMDNWLKHVRKILENPLPGEIELNTSTKMDLYSDTIFVFTPHGDLRKLKIGSTVLDFAFEIHTDVGSKCTGAKVNSNYVPLKYVLKTGDQIEVITSKNQHPSADWLNFVISSKAINKIRRYLKEAEFSQAELGKDILKRKISQLKLNYSDEIINKLVVHFKFGSPLELFQNIATEKADISRAREILLPPVKPDVPSLSEKPFTKAELFPKDKLISVGGKVIVNDNQELSDFKVAKCCHPVQGDAIFGFITVSEGIKIHRVDCPNARQMRTFYNYRLVGAKWNPEASDTSYLAEIQIQGSDQLGIVSSISQMISDDLKVDMRNIRFDSLNGKFDGRITVVVPDKKHLDNLLRKLLKIKGITKASRIN